MGRLDSPSLRSSPAEAIRFVVESVYRDYARAKFPNGDARLDDLEQLAQFAQSYESLPGFLEEVTLFNELSGEDVAAGEPADDRVVLSSVHQAKGLEWNRVAVMWLSEGRFPSYRASVTEGGTRGGAAPLLRRGHPCEERGRSHLPDAGAGPLRRGRHPGTVAFRGGVARRRLRTLDRRTRGGSRRVDRGERNGPLIVRK